MFRAMLLTGGFMLAEIGGGDAKTLCEEICRQVAEFEQGAQNDDVTVLVLGRPL